MRTTSSSQLQFYQLILLCSYPPLKIEMFVFAKASLSKSLSSSQICFRYGTLFLSHHQFLPLYLIVPISIQLSLVNIFTNTDSTPSSCYRCIFHSKYLFRVGSSYCLHFLSLHFFKNQPSEAFLSTSSGNSVVKGTSYVSRPKPVGNSLSLSILSFQQH